MQVLLDHIGGPAITLSAPGAFLIIFGYLLKYALGISFRRSR